MKARSIRIFLIFVATFTCLVVGWLLLHSITLGDHDDHGIAAAFHTIPDEENLFVALQAIRADNLPAKEPDPIFAAAWRLVDANPRNTATAQSMLQRYATHLAPLAQAIQRPSYQSGPLMWGPAAEQPDYRSYRSLFGLLLLNAGAQQQAARFDQATESMMLSIQFADRLRHDQNGTLLAYLFGQNMLQASLRWLERAIQQDLLTDAQLVRLQTMLDDLPEYADDGFRKALYGEYMTSRDLIDHVRESLQQEQTHQNRSGDAQRDRGVWMSLGSQLSEMQSLLLATGLYNYLLQPERTLQQRADQIHRLVGESTLPCKSQHFDNEHDEPSAWDFIKPGRLLKGLLWTHDQTYRRYFETRCLAQTRIESVRALIALERYRRATGELPLTLRELVPRYLKHMPRDWFDGSPLRFDHTNARVYSVGIDYEDAGGSDGAILAEHCHRESGCIQEPTFSLRRVGPRQAGQP